ncbi:MAG: AMP-binding protein [Rhizonema sp. PD37]|nr:AMP-binding protein [Rhizonema sp. PD37]
MITELNFGQCDCSSILQLCVQLVEYTINAVALVFEDQQLTYRKLNERAKKIAYYLQALGVGTKVLVGMCVERSLSFWFCHQDRKVLG